MNTDIYKISNSKIICRVLPFFARGRKLILFLEAISTPLIKLHRAFLEWAFEMVMRVKITSQTTILIWYLNYKFGPKFQNTGDTFVIEQDNELGYLVTFNLNEVTSMEILGSHILNTSEQSSLELLSRPLKDLSQRLFTSSITITAPAITTTAAYTNKNYLKDIREIVDNYKTSFVKYNIVIND